MFGCRKTPVGKIGIETDGYNIISLHLGCAADLREPEHPLLLQAFQELDEYFTGERKTFDLPLAPSGTPFQRKVWEALLRIPYGETRSYKEIAIEVECPHGFRAVGLANNRNPIAIFIPCHRVIGAGGKLVGFASGVENKLKLLDLEAGIGTLF